MRPTRDKDALVGSKGRESSFTGGREILYSRRHYYTERMVGYTSGRNYTMGELCLIV